MYNFLVDEGFDAYADTFRQRRINGRALLALNEETLTQLAVIEEEQEALLESIREWYETGHERADVRSWTNDEVGCSGSIAHVLSLCSRWRVS